MSQATEPLFYKKKQGRNRSREGKGEIQKHRFADLFKTVWVRLSVMVHTIPRLFDMLD